MSSKKVRNLFNKFGRTKSQSTTDLSEWSKSDEKLMKAVEGHDVKKVSGILTKKAMVPSKLGPRGHSIFHVACALGNAQIVDLLLKETDDVNDLTIQGNTCLQLAAAKGHEQVVQRLIQSGAEVDMRDSNDMTALHHACAGLHYGCVHALLQGGADATCTEKGGKSALFYAAHRGEISICKLLVDKGADVNAGDKMQITPLMVAAREGNRDACEFLLKRGANPNATNREGHMALSYATAAGHMELRDVFANAPTHASWDLKSPGGGASEKIEDRDESSTDGSVVEHQPQALSAQVSPVSSFTHEATPPVHRTVTGAYVHSVAGNYVKPADQSACESPLHRVSDSSGKCSQDLSPRSKDTQAYKELEAEHEQLNEEYHTLSIENLRLRDKVDYLQQQMNGKHEQGKAGKEVPHDVQEEIRNLKSLLEEEKEHCKELEACMAAKASDEAQVSAEVTADTDNWHDSDEEDMGDGKKTKGGKDVNDKQMVALLRSQILTLQQENDQLRNNAQALHNGYQENLGQEEGKSTGDRPQHFVALEAEKQELKAEILKLKESVASQELSGALGQEELIQNNSQLKSEVESLLSAMQTMEKEKSALQQQVKILEEEKAAMPSDKVAVMNSAKVMEEVKFDEEGFVDGQDLTKEEFLQAQNDQLKLQCKILTDELTKLRTTFDAILKAGDDLQADYDQLHSEKDELQDRLAVVVGEKEELVKENEFLLSDGNALHEDLKKLVQELEKMQEKYRKVSAEKEQLQHQQNAITIAGKVGEVARLLEEREKLQARLAEAEETSARLTHDQAILLEEVQSLQERTTSLTTERDSLQAEMEDAEALVTQNESLTQEYAQLEMDFNELLKEKERLEASVQSGEAAVPSNTQSADSSPDLKLVMEERDLLIAERDQLELTIKELSRENAALEEELETIRTRLAESGGDTATISSSTARLEETVKELSKENAELEEELANTQEHIADLEARLQTTSSDKADDGDMEAWKASVTQLEATVSELSQENAGLEEELESVKAQLDRSQEALENRKLLEGMSNPSTDLTISTLQQEKQSLADQLQEMKQRLSQSSVNGDLETTTTLNNNVKEQEHLLHTIAQLEQENSRLLKDVDSLQVKLGAMDSDSGGGKGASVNGMMGDGQIEELKQLREQMSSLKQQLSDLEQLHADTINTYRTHLLSAVQGHMDPEVKEALHSIIEMRSMEQFC